MADTVFFKYMFQHKLFDFDLSLAELLHIGRWVSNFNLTRKKYLNNDKYKLNYHEGNTLELDIKKQWRIDGFDAIICNPPYVLLL